MNNKAAIYTDGSCHTKANIGAWVAIILTGRETHTLSGTATGTTHNAMELTAVIRGIQYVQENYPDINLIQVITDSQYVVGLTDRKERLVSLGFTSRKGKELPNAALVKQLLQQIDAGHIILTKIKAHQKADGSANYNIEADKLSRKLVRQAVAQLEETK